MKDDWKKCECNRCLREEMYGRIDQDQNGDSYDRFKRFFNYISHEEWIKGYKKFNKEKANSEVIK